MVYIITKIHMKKYCENSYNLTEIESLLIGEQLYTKEYIHDYLKNNPGTIKVGTLNGPEAIPATSTNGEKFVKSEPNKNILDNLLSLPRI